MRTRRGAKPHGRSDTQAAKAAGIFTDHSNIHVPTSHVVVAILVLGSTVVRARPNDECASAITISCGQTLSGSTASALPDEALACGTTITARVCGMCWKERTHK